MAENAKLFRTAVGGFNKEDVAQYIEKMNFEFNRDISIARNEAAEWKSKCEKIEKELESRKASGMETERYGAKIAVLEENLAKSEATVKELIEKLSDAEERLNAQNDALDKLCVENENLKSDVPVSESKTDPEIEEKAKLYDKMSSKIGMVIMDANRNADAVISAAKDEAAGIISSAETEAEHIINNANEKAEAIYSDACRRADIFSNEYKALFVKYSTSISSSLKNIENEIDLCDSELKLKAEGLHKNEYISEE